MLFKALQKWLQTKYFRDIVKNHSKSDVLSAFKRKVGKKLTRFPHAEQMPRPVFFTHKWKQSMKLLKWNTTRSYVCAKYWLKTIFSEGEAYFLAKSVRNESDCWCDQSKLRPKEIPRVWWRERIRSWKKKFRQTVNSTKLTKVNYAHLISFSSSCSLTKVKPIDILPLPRKRVVFSGFHVRLCISPVHLKCTAVH